MGLIKFRKDIDQDAFLATLNSSKVNLTTYNSAMNDISNQFTTLRNDMTDADNSVKAYADSLKQSLLDNDIKSLNDAVTLINADASTDGSVDNKIKTAFDSIVNGAPEAYDTLKELLDLINNDDSSLNGLVTQVNDKVDAVVGAASDGWATLEDIENSTKAIQSDIQNQIDNINSTADDLSKSFPIYKYDNELAISSSNAINLSLVPYGDIMSHRATVYSTDSDTGDITIEGIYTIAADSNDTTGKGYIIDSSDDLSSYKASAEYFYRVIDNQ